MRWFSRHNTTDCGLVSFLDLDLYGFKWLRTSSGAGVRGLPSTEARGEFLPNEAEEGLRRWSFKLARHYDSRFEHTFD